VPTPPLKGQSREILIPFFDILYVYGYAYASGFEIFLRPPGFFICDGIFGAVKEKLFQ
jgi:hypothetical protein